MNRLVALLNQAAWAADDTPYGRLVFRGKLITVMLSEARLDARTAMDNRMIEAALKRHWDASQANNFVIEHEIYRNDAVLDYPQSGERIRGRAHIQQSRVVQPNKKSFAIRRIVGNGDLWITEYILTYDGSPSCVVSIMEFHEGLVARETQYFTDAFKPGPSRAHLVERMSDAAK